MIANEHKITNDLGKLAYQAHPTTIIYQPIVCVGRLASNRETIKNISQFISNFLVSIVGFTKSGMDKKSSLSFKKFA